MWSTKYRNSSRLWIHEFDNGYKVLTDLDLKENRILNNAQKLISVITFDVNYSIDDHNRFLKTIDEMKPVEANRQIIQKMISDHEYGDNMVEE